MSEIGKRERFALICPSEVDLPVAKRNTCREADDLHVNMLKNSILEQANGGDIVEGLLNPPTVVSIGDRWRIVDGQHRLKAIMQLIKEKKVPSERKWPFNVINSNVKDDISCLEKSVVFNFSSKQMTDFEIGNTIVTLMATKSAQYTQASVGNIFSRDQSWVSNHVKAFRLAREFNLMDLYKQNKVVKTDLLQIDSCKNKEDRESYISQIKENFLSDTPVSVKKIKKAKKEKDAKLGKQNLEISEDSYNTEESEQVEFEPEALVIDRKEQKNEPSNNKAAEFRPQPGEARNSNIPKSVQQVIQEKKKRIHPSDLIRAIYENEDSTWSNEDLEQIINYVHNQNEFSLPENLLTYCIELGFCD